MLPLAKILSANFINDYTVDVATFTALAKIKSGEIFMQYTSGSFSEIFLPRNISAIWYMNFIPHVWYSCDMIPFFSVQPENLLLDSAGYVKLVSRLFA